MGYYITTHKEGEEFDVLSTDFLLATEEEVKIADLALQVECGKELAKVKAALPSDLATIIYKRFLVHYIRQVQTWMNTSISYNIFGPAYRPSEVEEATRCIFVRDDLLRCVSDHASILTKNEYYFYSMSDDEVIEEKKKFGEPPDKPTEDGLIPIGASAFHVMDYEKVLSVTVIDRTGFLYYCRSADDHLHYIPHHQLFRTEEEVTAKIQERNDRRDPAIEKYHLLEESEDDSVNRDRRMALEWLYFNQNPPEGLIERLVCATAGGRRGS